LVLDKPSGLSSNHALQQVKRIYYAAKAGHTGSLDPLATGVLPLCFGEATKFSQYLLDADKGYSSTFVLGAESSTGDADGEIFPVADASGLTRECIVEALQSFQGEQQQIPPMYSALKHQGKRLYELARQGEEVVRAPRTVHIEKIALRDLRFFAGERAVVELDVDLQVSKGTYIRSIAADLGRQLAVGGYVAALRRTAAGPFSIARAVKVAQLEEMKCGDRFAEMDALLLPVDSALSHIPCIDLDASSGFYLRRGQAVQVSGSPCDGVVRLRLDSGEFVGIGEITDDGLVAPRRLVVA